MARPKESFRVPLPDGGSLSMAVFSTKNDPRAEVISVEVCRRIAENWVTDASLALYRSPEGNYRQLIDRGKPSKQI